MRLIGNNNKCLSFCNVETNKLTAKEQKRTSTVKMRQFVSLTVMVATALSMPTYEDGAYTGLVVRVGEEVPVADCTKLLVELQVDRKPGKLGKHET